MRKKTTSFLFFLILMSVFISCQEENIVIKSCRTLYSNETYLIEEESIPFFPFKEDHNLIFKDFFDNEVKFELIDFSSDSRGGLFLKDPCKSEDATRIRLRFERISTKYKCESLNIDFWISLSIELAGFNESKVCHQTVNNLNIFDALTITVGEGNEANNSISQENAVKFITSYRGNEFPIPIEIAEQEIAYFEKKSLLSKTFHEVYFHEKPITTIGQIEFLYVNSAKGIVAFTDREDKLWVFDRFEL